MWKTIETCPGHLHGARTNIHFSVCRLVMLVPHRRPRGLLKDGGARLETKEEDKRRNTICLLLIAHEM